MSKIISIFTDLQNKLVQVFFVYLILVFIIRYNLKIQENSGFAESEVVVGSDQKDTNDNSLKKLHDKKLQIKSKMYSAKKLQTQKKQQVHKN